MLSVKIRNVMRMHIDAIPSAILHAAGRVRGVYLISDTPA
jgi:hypothetical protein